MKTTAVALVAVLIAIGGFVVAARQQTPLVFRSQSTIVSVDASVRSGNKPVPDLTAADFALTDDGVLQRIDAVQIEAVPVDVTLAIDVSGSTRGLLERYRADVQEIAASLRPIDRLRLIGFGTDVTEALALQTVTDRSPADRLESSSWSAVYDGIIAAMLRPVGVDRRHLVVVFTDSYDNRSVTSPEWLMAAARRTEAVVHIVSQRPQKLNTVGLLVNDMAWQPPPLDDIADATGGAMHEPATTTPGNAGGVLTRDFQKIFADFRQSYVLRFTPTGVRKDGWHDLSVTVTRPGKFSVRSRRGYFGG